MQDSVRMLYNHYAKLIYIFHSYLSQLFLHSTYNFCIKKLTFYEGKSLQSYAYPVTLYVEIEMAS